MERPRLIRTDSVAKEEKKEESVIKHFCQACCYYFQCHKDATHITCTCHSGLVRNAADALDSLLVFYCSPGCVEEARKEFETANVILDD